MENCNDPAVHGLPEWVDPSKLVPAPECGARMWRLPGATPKQDEVYHLHHEFPAAPRLKPLELAAGMIIPPSVQQVDKQFVVPLPDGGIVTVGSMGEAEALVKALGTSGSGEPKETQAQHEARVKAEERREAAELARALAKEKSEAQGGKKG